MTHPHPQHPARVPARTRRGFLRQASVAGAALAFPTLIPSSAIGRGATPPPSGRITMGFIGVGGQGTGHLLGGAWTYVAGGFTGRPDVQVLAVCDVRRGRRESARDRVNAHYAARAGRDSWRSCDGVLDFREIIARRDIDAVLIATPAHWHATMTILAVESGKDVYCEKPSAVTLRESRAVADAVRRHGRVFQAGTQQRSEYSSRFRMACEFVRSGRVGRVTEVFCHRDGGGIAWPLPSPSRPPLPIPEDLDWDMYLGPAPWIAYDGNAGPHRFDVGELNWGQHHTDIIQWGLAADATGPIEAFVEDQRSALRYANGVVVHGRPHPSEPVGIEGGACFVGTAGRIAVDRNALVSTPGSLVRDPLRPDETALARNGGHVDNFLACVRSRAKPICDADVAHRSASALLLGGVAKQLGRAVRWDPVREEFPGDDAANRLREIAKRSPWRV